MSGISANYRQLDLSEVEQVAEACAAAWTDPAIPARQYDLAVRGELEAFRQGLPVAPFDALVRCLNRIPAKTGRRLLDVGASSGYYSEVLKIAGFDWRYQGVDFSPSFKELAERLYPGIDFDLGDAAALPYHDDAYHILLHGAVLMHMPLNYEKAIAEAARAAMEYVVFHRTPLLLFKPTMFFEKQAYGVRCMEVHFNEAELPKLFAAAGLDVTYSTDVFVDDAAGFLHRSYLCKKQNSELNHVQV